MNKGVEEKRKGARGGREERIRGGRAETEMDGSENMERKRKEFTKNLVLFYCRVFWSHTHSEWIKHVTGVLRT